jgi:hypothetical protein
MREIHQGLSYKEFARPVTGVIDVTVCAKSGLLKTAACNEGELTLPFLEGTQPSEYCNIHGSAAYSAVTYLDYMRSSALNLNSEALLDSLPMPALSIDLPSAGSRSGAPRNSAVPARRTPATGIRAGSSQGAAGRSGGNRLLDGEEPLPPVRQAPQVVEVPLREAAVDEAAESAAAPAPVESPPSAESAAAPESAAADGAATTDRGAAVDESVESAEPPAPPVADDPVSAGEPEEEVFSPWFE